MTGTPTETGELYHSELIGMLELIWGEGWLSPGGPDEVVRLIEGADLHNKPILDIAAAQAESTCCWRKTMQPLMFAASTLKTRFSPLHANASPEPGWKRRLFF
jgi:hypothetical protein